jgi:Family of unknown function (DUF6529)
MSAVPAGTADDSVNASDAPAQTRMGPLLVAFAVGSAVAIGLGVYGRLHNPTGQAVNLAGFSSGLAAKAWLTSIALLFGLVQLLTAMIMYGRIKISGAWVAPLHRWSGRLAVGFTVPVAVHCLYALGFQSYSGRVLVHSLLGCFLFGAFVTKMLILTRDDSPGWALPTLGGAVFSVLTALWMTASLWFFTTNGLTL